MDILEDLGNAESAETEEEVVERSSNSDTYTTKQIAELLQVGMTAAGRVMREIKSESDTLGISGIVHVQDYNYWLKVRLGKGKNYEKAKVLEKKMLREQRRRMANG